MVRHRGDIAINIARSTKPGRVLILIRRREGFKCGGMIQSFSQHKSQLILLIMSSTL